jgi:DNA (cytosine-5)-methyltransferase 1
MGVSIGSLFSGIGGFELGLERGIPGSRTVWQVEQDGFCQEVLRRHWPDAQLFDDVREVGSHNLEQVDVLCGGFPCQDISVAGEGGGLHGERSGLWWEMHRVIGEIRPKVVVLENVAALVVRGLREVLGGLAEIGYDAEWTTLSAARFGAPHLRNRVFIVAYPVRVGSLQQQEPGGGCDCTAVAARNGQGGGQTYWEVNEAPSLVCGVDDGISRWMDRHRALGNAIVPQCAEYVGRRIAEAGLCL